MAKENEFGMSDEQIRDLIAKDEKRRGKMLRDRVAHKLLIQKAKAAGLAPTKEEIDQEISRMQAQK